MAVVITSTFYYYLINIRQKSCEKLAYFCNISKTFNFVENAIVILLVVYLLHV